MSIDTIFLDLDGVCADLHARLAAIFGITSWPPGVFDLSEITGLSRAQLWGDPRVQGASFWRELEPTPFASAVVALCEKHAPVVFLSGTVLDPGSAAGKMEWLARHFPKRPFLLGPSWAKKHVARDGACLVDDSDRNVVEWIEEGGSAILFPRQWNSLHDRAREPLAEIEDALLSLVAS